MHQRRQQQSKSQIELLSSQALALDRARRIDYQDEQASGAGFRVAALLHHWMDTPSSNHYDTADQQEEEESVSQDAPGNSQRARFVTHFDLQRLQQWQRQKLQQQQQQQQQEDQLLQPAEPDEDPQEILRQQLLDANHQTKKNMDQTEQGWGPAEPESPHDTTLDEEAEQEQRRQEELRQQLLQAATGQHDNSQQQQQPQHPLEDGTTSNHQNQEHSPRDDFQGADSGVQDHPQQQQDDQDKERQEALRQELVHQLQQHKDTRTKQQSKPLHVMEEEGSKTQDTEEEERQKRLREQLINQQQINNNNLHETVKQHPEQDPHQDEQDERERQNALRDKLVKHMQNTDTDESELSKIQHRNGDELERKDVTEEQQQEENEDKRQDVLREKLLDQMNHAANQQDIQDDTNHVDSSQTRQLQDNKPGENHASKTGETGFRIRPMTELVPHHDKHETSVQQEEDMVPSPSDEASWQQPNRRLRNLADYSKQENLETQSGAASYPSQCGSNTTRVEITLVLQSTLDRAWILEETCRRWSDPIVAVLVLTHTQAQQEEVQHLQDWRLTCPQIHIVTHVLPPPPRNVSSNENHYAANDAEYYPVNHLRNLGLDAVQTSHVLLVDVDFVPSHNLPDQIRHTLELRRLVHGQQTGSEQGGGGTQEALIVPAFEKICNPSSSTEEQQQEEACYHRLRHDSSFLPRSFEELRDCVMKQKNKKNKSKNGPDGTCGVFQGRDNWEGHSSTHSSQWLSKAWYNKKQPISLSNGTTVHDIMPLECFDSLRYEPYVVVPWCPTRHPDEAPHSATNNPDEKSHPLSPYYDERFHGYGKNKIEYIQHLRFLHYKFWIVPQGFVIHNPHAESKAKHEWKDDIDTHKKHGGGGGGHSLHQDMDQLYPQFLTELVHLYVQPNESFSWLQDYPGVVGLCPETKAYLKKALAARAGDR